MDADRWLERADEAMASGDWTSVLHATERVLEVDPENSDALMLRGAARRQLARSPSSKERRFLTIMFVDLVGSTALSEQLDPEDFAAVLDRYHELVTDAISPFGGSVVKLLGDGVMAQFGYPMAIEKAPRRAALAAFQVIADLEAHAGWFIEAGGRPVQCRVGLHSGTAVVEGGDVVGDVPNVAAAIEGCAAVGGVAVSAETRALIESDYEWEPVVSRKDPQLTAFRITPKMGNDDDHERHALVGRVDELSELTRAWSEIVSGRSRVVTVVGEAGIGKSRLIDALRTYVLEAGDWVEGGTTEFRRTEPFHLFIDAIERRLRDAGIDPANIAAAAAYLGATEANAARTLSTGGTRTETEHPAQVRRAVVGTIIGWISQLAGEGPVAVVLEDLHWADPSSIEVLTELAAHVIDLPVLIVMTSRTASTVPEIDGAVTIELTPLTIDESRSLVESLASGLPREVRNSVAERAGGVPLFVTELARSVVGEGRLDERHLPHSLRDLLASRLDALGRAKRGAQVASVLGRTAPLELVRAVDPDLGPDEWLEQLSSAKMVERINGSVRFAHSLIQDAAYESLLRSERRRLHARAAEAVQQIVSDASPEFIAHHYTEAGKAEQAIERWMEAGRRAASRSAFREAVDHYQRAEALIPAIPAGPARDALELTLQQLKASPLTAVYGYAAPEVEEAYSRAAELGAASGDMRRRFATVRGLTSTRLLRAQVHAAHALGTEALVLAEESEDSHLLVEARSWLGTIEFFAGRFDEARLHLDAASAMYDIVEHGSHGIEFGIDPLVLSDTHRAWLHQVEGRPGEARSLIDDVLGHARELGHPLSVAHCLNYLAGTHQMQGDPEAQLEAAAEEVGIAQEYEFTHYIHYGRIFMAHAEASLGDARGVAGIAAALQDRLAAGAALAQPYHHWLIADAKRRHGDDAGAAVSLAAGRRVAEQTGELWWLPMMSPATA